MKNIDSLSICSLLQGRNPPRPCLQFINVKSLNYNLKSVPAASAAPIHRASSELHHFCFFFAIPFKSSDIMLKLSSCSLQIFVKNAVPRQQLTATTSTLRCCRLDGSETCKLCLEQKSCRTSEPYCCPKAKGITRTRVIYSFAAQQYILFCFFYPFLCILILVLQVVFFFFSNGLVLFLYSETVPQETKHTFQSQNGNSGFYLDYFIFIPLFIAHEKHG